MRSLRRLGLPRVMDTSSNDFVDDLFRPALEVSERYERGVGYFSSGWVERNAAGLAKFAENGGKARFITSPILYEKDWSAIKRGSEARESKLVKSALEKNLDDLESELINETLNALSWLIADDILEFKFAVPSNDLTGDFHDKFGIFRDKFGNRVSFNGSYNDSIQGLRNYESLKLFFSWQERDRQIIESDVNRFNRLWNNDDPNVDVFDIPASIRKKLINLKVSDRPYTLHSSKPSRPHSPKEISPRSYQKEAIQRWFQNNGRGIFKMATGTGKTITTLFLVLKTLDVLNKSGSGVVVIIICPYQHLVDQWYAEAINFGLSPLKCYRSKKKWKPDLDSKITEVNLGSRDHLVAISTNSTFRTKAFQKSLKGINSPLLFISDEVHNAGARGTLQKLPDSAEYRLGLSATPDRWYDEEGTQALKNYFGEVVFTYDLDQAISKGHLSRYRYYPILVDLRPEELEEYLDITREMAEVGWEDESQENEYLQSLAIKRARLTAAAHNKIPRLVEVLNENSLAGTAHNLFYCGDGRVGVDSDTHQKEKRQIDALVKVLGTELEMKVAPYVAETPTSRRKRLLQDFAEGDLEGLVAIRCLDEGVDIPQTKRAFILASSSNPRQFIQRRGRILRTAPGKDYAEIYDFVVIPPYDCLDSATFNTERKLIKKELKRVSEFADLAENGPQAQAKLRGIKKEYNLMHI